MNEQPAVDTIISLLAAVVRRWIRDASHNPAELAEIASWLEVKPEEIHKFVVKSKRVRHAVE